MPAKKIRSKSKGPRAVLVKQPAGAGRGAEGRGPSQAGGARVGARVGVGVERAAASNGHSSPPSHAPTSPTPPPPPDTRTRILDAAFQLFHEQGFHATGIATILRQADVNAGSLYHFFPSKEALLVGVLEYALGIMAPVVMAPAEAQTSDPIERVFVLLEWYLSNMNAWGCKMGCPIGNLALEVADDHAEVRRLIDANFRNWANHVKGWLDAAGDALPASTDRGQLAHFVLTVMEGGIMQSRAAGSGAPLADSIAQLRAYIESLKAIAGSERPGGGGRKAQRHAGGIQQKPIRK